MSEYRFNRIKAVLAEIGMTSKQLREKLGVSKTTVSNWCNNITQPSFDRLLEISQVTKVEYSSLLELPPKLKEEGEDLIDIEG